MLQSTFNRTAFVQRMAEAVEAGEVVVAPDDDFDPDGPADDGNPFGSPEDEITLEVDVAAFADLKREALRCHRSQVTDTSFFLEMPTERFRQAFGTEWFIETGVDAPMRRGWLFDIPD